MASLEDFAVYRSARNSGRRDIEQVTAQPLVAIVDDDANIRSGLSSLLRAEGYSVDRYGSAEEFLAALPTGIPDCLLTDIHLPTANGLDLQWSLLRSHPNLPVIVMTAFPKPSLRERATLQGAVCFLSKPFSYSELLRCIELALGR
jgi:FixJ family two-component response regulator